MLWEKWGVFFGTLKDDVFHGSQKNDVIFGFRGKDTLYGGEGDDFIVSGSGNDLVQGGSGNDYISAGRGNDTVIHSIEDNIGSKDVYNGGRGTDTLKLEVTQAQFDEIQEAGIQEAFEASNPHHFFDFSTFDISFQFNLKIRNFENLEFDIQNPTPPPDLQAKDDEVIVSAAENPNILVDVLENDGDDPNTFFIESIDDSMLPGNVVVQIQDDMIQFTGEGFEPLKEGETQDISFNYTASDGESLSTATVTVTVVGVNDAPVADIPIADQKAIKNQEFSLIIPVNAFRDVDLGDTLTLTAELSDGSSLPDWLEFDPMTGTFSGTPDLEDAGIPLDVKVIATDEALDSAESFFKIDVFDNNFSSGITLLSTDYEAREIALNFQAEYTTLNNSGDLLDLSGENILPLNPSQAFPITGEPIDTDVIFTLPENQDSASVEFTFSGIGEPEQHYTVDIETSVTLEQFHLFSTEGVTETQYFIRDSFSDQPISIGELDSTYKAFGVSGDSLYLTDGEQDFEGIFTSIHKIDFDIESTSLILPSLTPIGNFAHGEIYKVVGVKSEDEFLFVDEESLVDDYYLGELSNDFLQFEGNLLPNGSVIHNRGDGDSLNNLSIVDIFSNGLIVSESDRDAYTIANLPLNFGSTALSQDGVLLGQTQPGETYHGLSSQESMDLLVTISDVTLI